MLYGWLFTLNIGRTCFEEASLLDGIGEIDGWILFWISIGIVFSEFIYELSLLFFWQMGMLDIVLFCLT